MNQINSQRSEHASQVRAAREKFLGEADEAAKLRLRSNRKIINYRPNGKYRARYFTARWNG